MAGKSIFTESKRLKIAQYADFHTIEVTAEFYDISRCAVEKYRKEFGLRKKYKKRKTKTKHRECEFWSDENATISDMLTLFL